ncbi:MAG: hypothetical protein HYR64_09065, partial [Fimbriimonas ginsengisoli]|nr:hypothetical protein [Fimbriimonas ginsengisoli]
MATKGKQVQLYGPDQALRNVAGTALGVAALFLGIVAVLLNSEALFYMATAMVVLIAACRVQAWLSVLGLTVERVA